MESNNAQLHPVTWLALVALGFVGYLYIRQKSLEKKLTQGQPSYANQTRGPQATPYFGASSRQPNFSEKEIEPRKLAKELDTDTFKQRSPKYQPSFEQFGLSGDRNKRQGFEGLEKAFDDSRRMTSYKPLQKPIESYSVFSDLGKPEQPAPAVSSNVPVHSTPSHLINKGISLHSGGLSGKMEPEIENRLAQAPPAETQEIISTKTRIDDNDNEYKVFREFKQKETRILHEEPRRFESPQRQAWGVSPLDHSPDSPFRIFESSLAGSIKRDEDLVKHPKQRAGTSLIANKKDPFLKAQDALNERVNPIGSKLSKFAAKAESKNRSNQIFMDVDSEEDSMIVETQRGHGNINKRSGAESQSVDALERDTLKSKYFKDNNLKASFKGPEGKKITLGQSVGISQKAAAKDSKDQSKKKSSTDIAYLTEYGSNLTMKRYMERKALTDSAAKASRLSSSMIAPPRTSTSMIAEEPISRSLINKPVAIEKPKPAVQIQSFTSSLKTDGIMIGGSKTSDLPAKKPTVMESETTQAKVQVQEAPIKKDNKPDFGIKTTAEPAKISSILGGSSIFSQPKPAAESTTTTNGTGNGSLFGGKKQEIEEPKKITEVEPPAAKEETAPKEPSPIIETTTTTTATITTTTTQALPKGFNMGGDLFKTQKFGATIPTKPEENKEKSGGFFSSLAAPKKEEEEEPEKSTSSPKEQQPKAPLFGFLAGKSAETTTETEKAPAQQNGEKKTIFGGLVQPAATFGGFSNNPELKKEDSKKSETGSTSLFGSSKPAFGSGSLFGGKKDENTEKPAEEQPKTSFFNKTEQKQDAPAASGGIFGNLTKKTSSPDSSPKNEKPASGLGLFGNTSSSFLKSGTTAKEDDTQNKSSTPMFGSLKPVGSSSENKPSGSLFGNATSTLGGGPSLFSNAAAGSGSAPASGSLFGSGAATSLKTPSTGLFANLTSNSNKEGGSGGLFANLNK